MAAGWSEDEALSLVGRAAYEPWFGWVSNLYWDPIDKEVRRTPPFQPVPGLVPRIQEVLGQSWDPIEAFLLGATTLAVDDRTSNPLIQDPTIGHAHELFDGPFTTVRLGSGAELAFTTGAWTFGLAEIAVPELGGDLQFGSPDPEIHWAIVRTR